MLQLVIFLVSIDLLRSKKPQQMLVHLTNRVFSFSILFYFLLHPALIQLMAASVAGRQVCYFTFDDETLRTQLLRVHGMLSKQSISISKFSHVRYI